MILIKMVSVYRLSEDRDIETRFLESFKNEIMSNTSYDCWAQWGRRLPRNWTPNGLQIGPIRLPVAQTYGPIRAVRGIKLCSTSRALMTYDNRESPPSPPNSLDLDNEHDYIMNKALKSYKLHRDKEKAENRQRHLRSARLKRWKTPQPPRNIQSAGTERTRPVLLPKDAINEVRDANTSLEDMKQKSKRAFELHTVTVGRAFELNRITIGSTAMNQSPSPTKSASFQRRNSTSQQWYSQSVPSTTNINNHMRLFNGQVGHQSRHSHSSKVPRSASAVRSDSSTCRPESVSNYSYDGGIFLPNKPKHEYFVIHPDWVSESMTIQKLSLSERKPTYVSKTMTWPGRRCKSAPPAKLRNPITWDVVESKTEKPVLNFK